MINILRKMWSRKEIHDTVKKGIQDGDIPVKLYLHQIVVGAGYDYDTRKTKVLEFTSHSSEPIIEGTKGYNSLSDSVKTLIGTTTLIIRTRPSAPSDSFVNVILQIYNGEIPVDLDGNPVAINGSYSDIVSEI